MNDLAMFFTETIDACLECGLCTKVQGQSGCYELNYADFARVMLESLESGNAENVEGPAWSCTLCGACTAHCPTHISAYEFVYHARCALSPRQPHIVELFEPMRTDRETNIFRQLRAMRTSLPPDVLDEAAPCETLFFTGCALQGYAPELTVRVFNHLRETGSANGITYRCCGNPLHFMGDPELTRQASHDIALKLESCGTRRIITACASCHAMLRRYQAEGLLDASLQIVPLPVILADQGMTVSPQALAAAGLDSVSIKDVCRDRDSAQFAESVRTILGEVEVVELAHNRRNSRCCGAGGLVPLYDEEVSDDKRWSVLAEFDDTEASCLVTMCINCSVALRQDGDTNIVHYLELLFDQPIDWAAAQRDIAQVS